MKLTLALAAAAFMAAGPALADLVVPNMSYRTGPYAANGIPYADGFNDYFTLLNERDGGIGGVRVSVPECETAYNTERGVECYESLRPSNPLVLNPLSTGITYQIIPRASNDGIVIYTPGYGRTSAKNGSVFEWVFNAPANYWDGASVAVKHALEVEGGDLNGKKIALVYHNSAYGREPIRTLEELAEKHGFELVLLPVDAPGQEQKSQWLQIRLDRPDFVIMYAWGVMNQAAIQEAVNIRFPMDRFIGIWWSGSENDVRAAGAGADGYKALTFHGVGRDYPIYDELQQYVYDAGRASGAGDQAGTVLYSRGVYAAMVIAEAIRKGQELSGEAEINAAQLRDGFEALEITAERMEELGLPDFGQPIALTCENHGGDGLARIQQWSAGDGQWSLITDFIEPDAEVLDPLIAEDSAAFAAESNITPRCG